MSRPIVFDVTHLEHRLAFESPTGIDRVDLAFARHFALTDGKIAAGLHYGRPFPRIVPSSDVADLVHRVEARWGETSRFDNDQKFLKTRDWIRGGASTPAQPVPSNTAPASLWSFPSFARLSHYFSMRFEQKRTVPEGSIYLNIAQHAVEDNSFFSWLESRKDVQCVFFIHDLLPLDRPEFWWDGHEDLFSRRVDTMFRHATAIITSSEAGRNRIGRELNARGKPAVPILSQSLPSPIDLIGSPSAIEDVEIKDRPYFVAIGTIEPRKNHALLLNVWRRLASRRGVVPKLVVIGRRGWDNELVIGMLERCGSIRDHVMEVAGMSNAGVKQLLINSRGLLMPSYAEGYGLPLVEALSSCVPVIASDIPEFHEVTQDRAIFRDCIDGLGWSEAIEALSDLDSDLSTHAREQARAFRPPKWSEYFAAVESFLSTL
jgi:glycosyltransferase involved in cell wall biosynthesis